MHDEDIRRRSVAPAHEDEIVERSVLTEVLVLYPAQLTILELPCGSRPTGEAANRMRSSVPSENWPAMG